MPTRLTSFPRLVLRKLSYRVYENIPILRLYKLQTGPTYYLFVLQLERVPSVCVFSMFGVTQSDLL